MAFPYPLTYPRAYGLEQPRGPERLYARAGERQLLPSELSVYETARFPGLRKNCKLLLHCDQPGVGGVANCQYYDHSGNDNHAFILSAAAVPDFDGVDDYGGIAPHESLENLFDGGGTVACTLNPRAVIGNDFPIIHGGGGWRFILRIHDHSSIVFNFRADHETHRGVWLTPPDIRPYCPNRIVVTYTADVPIPEPIIYINGVKYTVDAGLIEDEVPQGARVSNAGESTGIGALVSAFNTLDGQLYDLVFDRTHVWTDAEARQDWLTHDLHYAGMTAWYPCDDGTGFICANSVFGGAGNMTLGGGVTWRFGRLAYHAIQTRTGLPRAADVTAEGAGLLIPYSPDLTFGDGVTDRPFSVGIYGEVTLPALSSDALPIIEKRRGLALEEMEYGLRYSSTGMYDFICIDDDNSAQVQSAAGLSADGGKPESVTVIGTYDGRGGTEAAAGFRLYRNGEPLDLSNTSQGLYVAMSDLAAPLLLANAKFALFGIFDIEQDSDWAHAWNAWCVSGGRAGSVVGFGSAFVPDFDGVDDYGLIAPHESLENLWDGGGTLACTLNPRAGDPGGSTLIDGGGKWELSLAKTDRNRMDLDFYVEYNSGAYGHWLLRDQIRSDYPNRIVVTYTADVPIPEPIIYINGVKYTVGDELLIEFQVPQGARVSNAGEPTGIGALVPAFNTLDGQLYDLVFENARAWTDTEVEQDWQDWQADTLNYAGMTAWYPCDEGEGDCHNAGTGGAGDIVLSGVTWQSKKGNTI